MSNMKVNVEQVDFHKTMKTEKNPNVTKLSVSAVFPKGVKQHLTDEKRVSIKSFHKAGHGYGKIINIEELGKSPVATNARRMGSLENNLNVDPNHLDIR